MELRVADRWYGDLRARLLSSILLAPVAVAAVLAGGPWFDLMIAVIGMVLVMEWHRLYRRGQRDRVSLGLEGGTIAAAIALGAFGRPVAAIAVVAGCAAAMALVFRQQPAGFWGPIGVAYVSIPCLALIWLRLDPASGTAIVLWLVLVVWATDIGAYFVGRLVGGPKLWAAISPSKTWAGLVGGTVAAAVVGLVVAGAFQTPGTAWLSMLGAPMAVVAQAGDLTESAVKRHFGVKDSGHLIPGHGGLFDRVDGLLFAATAVAVIRLVVEPGG
ncbi:MAG: phosphatidate cytidylyltransferase [Alphaproteobacteria bacterium]|nr:phosphatidate cytidylyltransferase [Alphaproteobacteria bacterium]